MLNGFLLQLLSMQCSNGGYASYEIKRGSTVLELLNPAEVFGEPQQQTAYTALVRDPGLDTRAVGGFCSSSSLLISDTIQYYIHT